MNPENVRYLLFSLFACAGDMTRNQVKELYRILIAHENYPVCSYCRQPITSIKEFTWDHIYPKFRGGSDDIANMQPMHRNCNLDKGNTVISRQEITYELTLRADFDLDMRIEASAEYRNRKTRGGKKNQKWHGDRRFRKKGKFR